MDGLNRIATPADRIRSAMADKGLKQVDLVNATGLDKGQVSSYLSGKYEPKQLAINKLASALDVSEMWLWGYDVAKERSQKQKNNDAIADIVVKLRTDEKFFKAVVKIYNFDSEKLDSFLHLID
jgi:transcriptional regulator with XRE-family HTH domain